MNTIEIIEVPERNLEYDNDVIHKILPLGKTIPEYIEELVQDKVWVTKYGTKIPVTKMTTQHVQNTIKCWEGSGKSRIPLDYLGGKEKWLTILRNELLRRGTPINNTQN